MGQFLRSQQQGQTCSHCELLCPQPRPQAELELPTGLMPQATRGTLRGSTAGFLSPLSQSTNPAVHSPATAEVTGHLPASLHGCHLKPQERLTLTGGRKKLIFYAYLETSEKME